MASSDDTRSTPSSYTHEFLPLSEQSSRRTHFSGGSSRPGDPQDTSRSSVHRTKGCIQHPSESSLFCVRVAACDDGSADQVIGLQDDSDGCLVLGHPNNSSRGADDFER